MAAAGLAAIGLGAGHAGAHPHMFLDGGADFLFDAEGRVEAIRVVWIYDSFASLFIVESLGLDTDGDGALTDDERARVVEDQTTWEEEFTGDSFLWHGGAKIGLSGPGDATADYAEGRLTITFVRRLESPVDPRAAEVEVKLYDPTYYFAYFATHAPQLEGAAPDGCAARVEEFEANESLASLQGSLALLSPEETPEQADVGALFADRILLACE